MKGGVGVENRGVFVNHEMCVPEGEEEKCWRKEYDERKKEIIQ